MQLRPYQSAALQAAYDHLERKKTNPVVVIPTGGGKTPVIARLCHDVVGWGGRVIVLAHIRELLQQIEEKIRAADPSLTLQVGVYSAGLRSRDTDQPIVVAGIQSAYQRAAKFGRRDLIIIDEAHLVPASGEGMYQSFLADLAEINPGVRVVGLTATPYRLDAGPICAPDNILQEICCEVDIKDLQSQGFLSPLRTRRIMGTPDTSEIRKVAGDFAKDEIEELFDEKNAVARACCELVDQARGRKSILIFAAGVRHGADVAKFLEERLECAGQVGQVYGDTPDEVRADTISRFRAGALRFLINVNVLSIGFDAPNVDCVALLFATASPGRYYQAVGRGFRVAPGKADCLILDFGENVVRHGPVDLLSVGRAAKTGGGGVPPMRVCDCGEIILAALIACPQCGHEYPRDESERHGVSAAGEGFISGQVTITKYEVKAKPFYEIYEKRNAPPDHPRTMRVTYCVGWHQDKSEWICVEHPPGSYARRKAEAWWAQRSRMPCPKTADDAVAAAEAGALAMPAAITVRHVAGEKYDSIVDYDLGPIPEIPGEESPPPPPPPPPEPEPWEVPEDQIPF